MRAVLTGGGTGGHIYPALAVGAALRLADPSCEITYVGASGGMEEGLARGAGYPYHGVPARKMRKLASPDTVLVLLALARGYRAAGRVLAAHRPDVVIGTGGYVAAATVIAAARQRIPTLMHEQNAVAGRTNLWLSRWARCVCVSFRETLSAFRGRVELTGVPVRRGIVSPGGREHARAALGLDAAAFTLLALGGSQGAQRLNEVVLSASASMAPGLQVVHHVGARNYVPGPPCVTLADGVTYHPRKWLDDTEMPLAYRAADLVLCRCGASTLAEVAANGLPALLVPLPEAYADHQTANARCVEREGAGILMPQGLLTAEALRVQVEALRGEPATLGRMADASRGLGRPDAAARVAELARELARAG